MTVTDVLTNGWSALILGLAAGVTEAVKDVAPDRVACASWFRRSLPLLSAVLGVLVALLPIWWPAGTTLGERAQAGLILGFGGPALKGLIKAREKTAPGKLRRKGAVP